MKVRTGIAFGIGFARDQRVGDIPKGIQRRLLILGSRFLPCSPGLAVLSLDGAAGEDWASDG